MGKVPGIVPIIDLCQDAAAVLKRVRSSRDPLVITRRGLAAVVMFSIKAYERTEQKLQILMLLAPGENEIAEGKGL